MRAVGRLSKALSKALAVWVPGNRVRVFLLRRAGYRVGRDVYVGVGLVIVDDLDDRGMVSIGDRASVAPRVTLVTRSYPNNSRLRDSAPVSAGPIRISEDAWLGAGSIVLPGTVVGEGSVVGAGAVVTRDVPPLTVVAGVPAKPLRSLRATAVKGERTG